MSNVGMGVNPGSSALKFTQSKIPSLVAPSSASGANKNRSKAKTTYGGPPVSSSLHMKIATTNNNNAKQQPNVGSGNQNNLQNGKTLSQPSQAALQQKTVVSNPNTFFSPRTTAKQHLSTTPIIEEEQHSKIEMEDKNNQDTKQESIEIFSVGKVSLINESSKTNTSSLKHPVENQRKSQSIYQAQSSSTGLKKPTKLPSTTTVQQTISKPQTLTSPFAVQKQQETIANNNQQQKPQLQQTGQSQKNGMSKEQQQNVQFKTYQQQSKNQQEDDEFIDDMLDDSMELHESNSVATSASQSKSKTSSIISHNKQHQHLNPSQIPTNNNKINTTSPSKLNSKFQGSQMLAKTQPPSTQSKQQNIKTSAIQGKKTLQSLQATDTNKEPTAISQHTQQQQQQQVIKPVVLDLLLNNQSLLQIPLLSLQNSCLRSIDLRNNKLTSESLPREMFNLENLWKLQLDNNNIQELPDWFEGLPQIRQITMSSNTIQHIPNSLLKVKNIEKMDISSNKIKQIQNEIGGCTTLKYLFISDNKITQLPKSLCQLKNLQQLTIEWCQYIGPSFEKIIKRSGRGSPGSAALNNSSSEDSILMQFLVAMANSQANEDEQVDFFQFMQSFYGQQQIKSTLQQMKIHKKSLIIHFISKYNHTHLFDLMKIYKQLVDINVKDEHNQTPLMIAINEKSSIIVDKIIREYKEQLDLTSGKNDMYLQANEQLPQQLQSKVLHPLVLAVKHLQYETALRILAIMVKQHHFQQGAYTLDLNFKDEQKNTVMHLLFANFSNNMELSVELCQEMLKQGERSHKTQSQIALLKLNEMNKQGLTPIDLATEIKQNQALEFAIYYNKNLLPAFKPKPSNKQQQTRSEFDLNFNSNSRGVTPIHRAIMSQNYKAIYLLLQSGDCNLFLKDREFLSPRDYCQKILFLSKYLRKGESNFLRQLIFGIQKSQPRQADQYIPNANSAVTGIIGLFKPSVKAMTHNNINFFGMSIKKGSRVKYNSWYTRLGANTNNQNDPKNPNTMNMLLSSSQQPTLEKKGDEDENEDDEEAIRIEDLKDSSISDLENATLEDDSCKQHDKKLLVPKNKISSLITVSVVEQSTTEKLQLVPAKGVNKPQTSQFNSRRLSDQTRKIAGLTSRNNHNQQNNTTQSKASFIKQKEIATTIDKRLKIQHLKPTITQDNLCQQAPLQRKPTELVIEDVDEENALAEEVEADEADEESPTSLPSNKYKYIMPVNNSKLARKPYYKLLQKNKYERDFCLLMDHKISFTNKIQILYKVFAQLQEILTDQKANNQQLGNNTCVQTYRDGREFFGFLKLELENKDENIIPLKHEVQYFQEFIIQNASNFSFMSFDNNYTANNRKNTNNNFSLERGPLPAIQEAVFESQKQIIDNSPFKKKSSNSKVNSLSVQKNSQYQAKSKQQLLTQKPDHLIINPQDDDKSQSSRMIMHTASSQKKLDNLQVQSQKPQNTLNTKKQTSKQEEKKQPLKVIAIQYEDQETNNNKSPTSPRGNSGQIQSKHSNQNTFIFQSPTNSNSQQQSNSYNHQKTKDSCIKKIEVQITQQDKISGSPGQDKLNQKWKQLTINPQVANQQQQQSGIGKGITATKSSQPTKLSTTPQSQRNQASQLTNQNSIKQQPLVQSQQQQLLVVTTNSTQQHNKTSSSLSNRSTSNPRNSLINGSASTIQQKGRNIGQQQLSDNSTSGLKKPSNILQKAQTTVPTTMQTSGIKPKTTSMQKPQQTTITRNTIGRPSTRR